MVSKGITFKSELRGKRLILKRTTPNIELARIMFKVIDENRKHLRPWFPWEKLTLKVEDTMKYLFDKEEQTKLGNKIEYGLYLGVKYVGNIGIFDINLEKKSAEIGYWISKSFTGKGYVTEAVSILEREAFNAWKLNRIQIKCDETNIGSARVAQKSGYSLEGKLREDRFSVYYNNFRNTLVFSKLRSEFNK